MPYARRKRYKRKYRKKKGKAKYRQQMLSTNTVSQIARKIAKAEDRKNRITLVSRLYLFPENANDPVYDMNSNEFGNGLPIDYQGKMVRLMKIYPQDIRMAPLIQPLDDPLTAGNDSGAGDSGNAYGLAETTIHGHRTSETVKMTGCSIDIRVRLPPGFGETEHDENNGGPKLFGAVKFRYAVVLWRNRAMDNPQTHPDVRALLPWKGFGYSSALDIDHERYPKDDVIRTLLKGEVTLRQTDSHQVDRTIRRFVKLKTPVTFKWDVEDQAGLSSKSWRCYFVCRSNVPSVLANSPYDIVTPKVIAATKCYYYEP